MIIHLFTYIPHKNLRCFCSLKLKLKREMANLKRQLEEAEKFTERALKQAKANEEACHKTEEALKKSKIDMEEVRLILTIIVEFHDYFLE